MVAVGAPSAVPSDSTAPHSGTELLEHMAQCCALFLQPGGAAGGTQVGMEQGDEMARLPTPRCTVTLQRLLYSREAINYRAGSRAAGLPEAEQQPYASRAPITAWVKSRDVAYPPMSAVRTCNKRRRQ